MVEGKLGWHVGEGLFNYSIPNKDPYFQRLEEPVA